MEKTKTYKREVACALVIVSLATGVMGVWVEPFTHLFDTMIYPSFSFLALAFGLDWKSKQT